jgi:signal transduction histidine kinase
MHPFPQRLALSLAALALGLVLAALVALALLHQRSAAINSQARELNVLLLALADEIHRGLQGAEVGLHAMRLELSDGRRATTGAEAQRALRIRAELMPLVKMLWLVDANGHVISASDNTPSPALNAFSPPPEKLGIDAVAISRPFEGKSLQYPLVALCVRFSGTAGGSGGWILAAIPANSLRGAFSVAAQAPDARMAVFRDDGVRLSGSIVAAQPLDENAWPLRLATAQSIELRHFRDGSERLVGLHTLPRYDLQLKLTRDVDAVLGPWRAFAKLATMGVALILAIMAIAVYLVLRANQWHAEAEHALQVTQSRASRLTSLGTLAGGVAHDFNNVLAAILGYGEMAHDTAPQGSDQRRYIDQMLHATQRGKALVERILAFSRGGARVSTVFELAPVVEQALALLAGSLPPGVVLERGLDAPGARLRGDSTQIFEAVMNLCTNAIQAMPEGGILGVRLARERVTTPRLLSHAQLAAGEYLVLGISDQGAGIVPEVMERLFEPFFTTRGTQAGTGLGLAVVHGVMAELDGAIDVQSTPGQGARFSLYFPECTDALDPVAAVQPFAPRGTGQLVLVVDDEATLVELLKELLNGLGYSAVGFTDPSAALQALHETPQRFAAVITDEVMPGLSGTQLIQELRVFDPRLPVLLISGYGGAALAARAAAAGATRVLAKPLQRTDLACALAEVMR